MEMLWADRSARGKLRLTGPQRAWFLHQILTQSFEDIVPGEAREAAKITAHGRMVGYLEVLATEDALLCHFEPELIETLPEEIRRYVFATQVEVEDVTKEVGLVLVAGEGWRELGNEAAPGAPLHPTRSLGVPAGYIWIDRSAVEELLARLGEGDARPASEVELEAIRISNGVPRWGREMGPKTLPQESGVDAWAVHYDKGCYVGQEAMAKIHFRGKTNRRLVRLAGEGLTAGEELALDGVNVGRVTSVADGGQALALVKHTVESGARLTGGRATAEVSG